MASTSGLQGIYDAIEAYGQAIGPETRAAYELALGELSPEWRDLRELSEDIMFYDTLTDFGLAERRNEQLTKHGHPCGFHVLYRLAA